MVFLRLFGYLQSVCVPVSSPDGKHPERVLLHARNGEQPKSDVNRLKALIIAFKIFNISVKQTIWPRTTDYISSWREQPSATRMYPFGESYLDNVVTNRDGEDAQINFLLPFYGSVYSSAYIATEGHIELSSTTPATNTPKAPATWWPNDDYPQTEDVPFISPYYAQFEMTSLPHDKGRLYWRRVDPSEETNPAKTDIATNMVAWLSGEVRQYVVGSERFDGDYAIIATWNESTFYACVNANCPTNTVQVAVVTDEKSTYVIYNYYELTWIGSIKQGYDPETGVLCQGDCVPAQVGFNAGRAQAFYSLPFSGTDDVLRLAETSGTGVTGRFIYEVNSFDVTRGGCSNISDIDPVDWPLELNPSHGTMLGGEVVYVSGPCYLPHLTVQCKFDDVVVGGWRLDDDYTRCICITPFLGYTGRIGVKLSTNNGKTWPYVGWFEFDSPDDGPELVTLDNPDHWNNKTVQMLSFHWDSSALEENYETMANSSPPFNVDVRLCAYFETVLPDGSTGEIQEVRLIGDNIPNSGMYTFSVDEHRCSDPAECQWEIPLPVALLEIRRTTGTSWTRKIWSGPFAFGWYGNSAWNGWHGDDWAEQFCSRWFDYEMANTTWYDDLEPCPVTERQALADSGRFVWNPCNSSSPGICYSDQRMSCYDQLTPKTNQWPAVSHCCYNNEGCLVYATDSNEGVGSSSSKATLRGDRKATYGKVPVLSHYSWDSIFRILCCNWTSDPKYCRDMYMKVRSTKDAKEYKTSQSTTSFGDPHFRTYDGVDYTFNGRGEYWLLRVYDMDVDLDNIAVQVRLEKPSEQKWGDVKATIITGVVIQEGYADDMTVPRIEVLMAEPEATVRQKLLISGEVHDLKMDHNRKLEIAYRDNSRLIIIANNELTSYPDNKQSNISVIFQSGIMVQIAYVDGALHIISSLPYKYKGRTAGLFGLWSDMKDDDLTTPGGEPIDYTRGNEFIHYNFGEKWVLSDAESRFTYRGSLKSSDYHHPEFVPYFTEPILPPNSTLTEKDVDEACGTDFVCRFDYKTTLSRSLAVRSSVIELWTSEIVEMSLPVPVCPYLDVPYGRREVSSYTSGGSLTFTGCTDGYTLQGYTEYACVVQNGSAYWQPTPDALCKANSEIAAEKQHRAIMIAVPICCILVAAGLAIGGYFLYKRNKSISDGDAPPTPNQLTYRSGSSPVGPVTVNYPNADPELRRQWMGQSVTLAGSADLGCRQTYGSQQLSANTTQDQGVLPAPDPQYARIVHNRMTIHDGAERHEVRPATSESFSFNSFDDYDDDDQTEDRENSCNEILQRINQHSSGSQADLSHIRMHQSQLNASELQLHATPMDGQPVIRADQDQNALTHRSVPDLIQLDGSASGLARGEALDSSGISTNRPQFPLSARHLSQSDEGLHHIQSYPISEHGYTNLAASVGSLNRSIANSSRAGSRLTSQTSVICEGGHDNVALATDEALAERPASRFATYAATFGNDTVV
ncbi:hypothetical protein LSH36_108g00007 [Paralvinella palmiformis]|uniref:Sushi domain-containing protein n=1 Tax=Paralvinella palmiformis TaxID=53620 RepID=A0AAD9JYM1_9ANNE|nr:hypothetical protein LSH36_108g00007 [Paralvinella palmiformis]